MPYTPLRDVRNLVARCQPFEGNNIFAEKSDYAYAVYSYRKDWPILINIAGLWFKNQSRYSRTTSKHMGYAVPLYTETRPLPVDNMNDLLNPNTPPGSAMKLLAMAERAAYGDDR